MMKNNGVNSLAVIGGGASGLIAAIFAAREAEKCHKKVHVTIYESNSRVGKKILVTGNGRCNFTNENIAFDNFHGDSSFAMNIYRRFTNRDVIDFFRSVGLFAKSDAAGRVYPMSSQASAVLDALRFEVQRLGIEEKTDTPIISLKGNGRGYILNGEYYADKCIIATGGMAAPVHGSNGSGFELLKPYSIEIESLNPALTALCCENFPKSLKGIRAQGKISVKCSGKLLAEDTGEIQYTDYGLSGIPSMQVSRYVSSLSASEKSKVYAHVDSCPCFSSEELRSELIRLINENPTMPGELLLAGIMPKRLGLNVLVDCSINPSKEIGKINSGVVDKIVTMVKNKKYRIVSVRGFNDAQVTCGGIKSCEMDENTLELKKLRGIYVCGEMLNVDGDCGGYNLQWAWSSGVTAGKNAVREI